jgi:hypothetical protein
MRSYSKKYFLIICRMLVIASLASVCSVAAFSQTEKGLVTLENLLRALGDTPPLPAPQLVALLNRNGVDFQLTDESEQRIRSVGKSYRPAAMTSILAAVRRNFRAASSRTSPLQVQYRLVAGNSIDFFLRKSVKKDWQILDIDGRVSIASNDTYKTLAFLARTFSVPFARDYFDFANFDPQKAEESDQPSPNTEAAAEYKEKEQPIFVGSGGQDTFPSVYMDVPNLVSSLENAARPWRISVRPKLEEDFGSPLLKARDIEVDRRFCLVLTNDPNQPEPYKGGASSEITAYLSDQLSPAAKAALSQCVASPRTRVQKDQIKVLLDDLNRVVSGPLLSEKIKQTPAAKAPTTVPSDEGRIRLNRQFLVNAYRHFIRGEHEPSLHFLKQLEKEDFAQLDVLGRFYEYITRNNLPPDFGYLETSIRTGSGGGCDFEVAPIERTVVKAPYLAMWIAVFENTGDKPLNVGNFTLRENPSDRLRTPEDDAKAINNTPAKQVALYPLGLLKPTEKIIVPLQLVVMYPDELNLARSWGESSQSEGLDRFAVTSTQITTAAEEKLLRSVSQIALPSGRIKTETLVEILKRPPVTFATRHKYLFGPSVKIENVDVNQAGYLVRSFNPDKPMITSSGYMGASCPYLHTYDWTTKSWTNEGTVITGFDSKLNESTDVKKLQRFAGRILLEEREAEDSFIDAIVVRAKTFTGAEVLLFPRNNLLLSNDGRYLKLSQGQSQVVDFDMPKAIQVMEYEIEVSGYYVPYNPNRNPSQRKRLPH